MGTAFCNPGHPMSYIMQNPVPGATGIACDQCNSPVNVNNGFHHCYTCAMDLARAAELEDLDDEYLTNDTEK